MVAGMGRAPGRSVRRNETPSPDGAGRNRREAARPEKRPTPRRRASDWSVRRGNIVNVQSAEGASSKVRQTNLTHREAKERRKDHKHRGVMQEVDGHGGDHAAAPFTHDGKRRADDNDREQENARKIV